MSVWTLANTPRMKYIPLETCTADEVDVAFKSRTEAKLSPTFIVVFP